MKKLTMVMVAAAFVSGCVDGSECDITATETGGSRIECPGEPAVVTDEAVAPDAQCQVRDEQVVCTSGQRFEIPEEGGAEKEDDVGGGAVDAGGGDDAGQEQEDAGGFGSIGAGATPWESSCDTAGDQVTCRDGARATIDGLEEGTSCSSRMVPGVGRRIVCEDGTEVRPEEGSAEDVDVSCDKKELEDGQEAIHCSDGAFAFADSLPADCEPNSSREGDQVVVTCGAFEVELETTCNGTVIIESQEDLEEFYQMGCYSVWGDLVVRDTQLEQIDLLAEVQFVGGSVIIVDNEKLQSFGVGDLYVVRGDLVVRNNPSLTHIGRWGPLWGVDGNVEFSGNTKVEWIEARPWSWVHGSWVIGGHENLAVIGEWSVDEERVYYVLPPTYIEDVFMFTDNTSYGLCLTEAIWKWAMARAETAYIGNNGKGPGLVECPGWL